MVFAFGVTCLGCGFVFSMFFTVDSNNGLGFSSGLFFIGTFVGAHLVLSREQFAAIGELVVECSDLEMYLDGMLGEMLRLKKHQYDLLMEGAMLQRKLNLMCEIGTLKLKSKKRKTELSAIIGALKHCNSERVIAVHGNWETVTTDRNFLARMLKAASGLPVSPTKAVATKSGVGTKVSTLDADKIALTIERVQEWRGKLISFWAKALMSK